MEVRGKLYELMSHCILPTVILKVCRSSCVSFLALATADSQFTITSPLSSPIDGRRYTGGPAADELLKADVIYWAAFYERRMRIRNKKIFHLEAWVIKVTGLYKVMCTSIY